MSIRSVEEGDDERPGGRIDREYVPFALPDLSELEAEAAVEAIRSGWLTTGRVAADFEREFAEFLGGGEIEAVAVNSATAGLHLALEGLGIGEGDEVIVPVWTFTATAEAVKYLGATPVFVDVVPETLNIDLEKAAKAITSRTKAIMPVHFAGLPVPRYHLEAFSRQYGIQVVEDSAHAFPVVDADRWVGNSDSAAVVFSFYATKTMTTGEGGMLVTRDPQIARRARLMRLHGIDRDVFDRYSSRAPKWYYEVVAPGFKYNLTDLAASIGRVQLKRSLEMREARSRIASRYLRTLRGLPITLPAVESQDQGHAWHLFVIRLEDEAAMTRNEFVSAMSDKGVATSVHFIPLHKQPYWRDSYGLTDGQFPVASDSFDRVVSLPIFSAMLPEQIDQVEKAVVAVLGNDRAANEEESGTVL